MLSNGIWWSSGKRSNRHFGPDQNILKLTWVQCCVYSTHTVMGKESITFFKRLPRSFKLYFLCVKEVWDAPCWKNNIKHASYLPVFTVFCMSLEPSWVQTLNQMERWHTNRFVFTWQDHIFQEVFIYLDTCQISRQVWQKEDSQLTWVHWVVKKLCDSSELIIHNIGISLNKNYVSN